MESTSYMVHDQRHSFKSDFPRTMPESRAVAVNYLELQHTLLGYPFVYSSRFELDIQFR